MASYQAKMGWKMPGKREYKNFRSVPPRPVREHSKKIQKIKKYHYGIISGQNRLEKAEKESK